MIQLIPLKPYKREDKNKEIPSKEDTSINTNSIDPKEYKHEIICINVNKVYKPKMS